MESYCIKSDFCNLLVYLFVFFKDVMNCLIVIKQTFNKYININNHLQLHITALNGNFTHTYGNKFAFCLPNRGQHRSKSQYRIIENIPEDSGSDSDSSDGHVPAKIMFSMICPYC